MLSVRWSPHTPCSCLLICKMTRHHLQNELRSDTFLICSVFGESNTVVRNVTISWLYLRMNYSKIYSEFKRTYNLTKFQNFRILTHNVLTGINIWHTFYEKSVGRFHCNKQDSAHEILTTYAINMVIVTLWRCCSKRSHLKSFNCNVGWVKAPE